MTGDPPMPTEDPGEQLAGMSIWAIPGLVDDPTHPEIGAVGVLTVVPARPVSTRDAYPGADEVDVIVSQLLGRGFGLLTSPDVSQLVALPVLEGVIAALRGDDSQLRITDRGVAVYDGQMGPVPPGWHASVRRVGRLTVVVSTRLDLYAEDRAGQIAAACAAGAVVGAQIPMDGDPAEAG
jgi:hypothetical protein